MIRHASLAATLFVLNVAIGCRFDPSAPGSPNGPLYAGCFQSSEGGGMTLRLESMGNLLNGSLVTGQGVAQQVFVLAGRAETATLALLEGTRAGSDGQAEEITVLRVPGDTMIVQIADGPPSAPLSRCP
jgi:hypothetical protein